MRLLDGIADNHSSLPALGSMPSRAYDWQLREGASSGLIVTRSEVVAHVLFVMNRQLQFGTDRDAMIGLRGHNSLGPPFAHVYEGVRRTTHYAGEGARASQEKLMNITEKFRGAMRRMAGVSCALGERNRSGGRWRCLRFSAPTARRQNVVPKPTAVNLRRLGETPVARKAINTIVAIDSRGCASSGRSRDRDCRSFRNS